MFVVQLERDEREWVVGDVRGQCADSVQSRLERGEADVAAGVAADECDQVAHTYALPRAAGTPPFNTGDREVAGVLWHGPQLIDGEFLCAGPIVDGQSVVGALGRLDNVGRGCRAIVTGLRKIPQWCSSKFPTREVGLL